MPTRTSPSSKCLGNAPYTCPSLRSSSCASAFAKPVLAATVASPVGGRGCSHDGVIAPAEARGGGEVQVRDAEAQGGGGQLDLESLIDADSMSVSNTVAGSSSLKTPATRTFGAAQQMEAVMDLAGLSFVSDDVIVACFRERFLSDTIYINLSTPALVALNPQYAAAYRDTGEHKAPLPPHIFQLANNAYYHMKRTPQDQSILFRRRRGGRGSSNGGTTSVAGEFRAALDTTLDETQAWPVTEVQMGYTVEGGLGIYNDPYALYSSPQLEGEGASGHGGPLGPRPLRSPSSCTHHHSSARTTATTRSYAPSRNMFGAEDANGAAPLLAKDARREDPGGETADVIK
ncbi:hypothetical protein B0H11DRAFT_2229526 [Mycena galericulata]|nr:hypothetical protein B0H11DRAFT_2229526 [Mycena galericulata]